MTDRFRLHGGPRSVIRTTVNMIYDSDVDHRFGDQQIQFVVSLKYSAATYDLGDTFPTLKQDGRRQISVFNDIGASTS